MEEGEGSGGREWMKEEMEKTTDARRKMSKRK